MQRSVTELVEPVRRDKRRLDLFGGILAPSDVRSRFDHHRREHGVVLLHELGHRVRHAGRAAMRRDAMEARDAGGRCDRGRPQERGSQHLVQREVQSDSEGENQRCRHGKGWRSEERSNTDHEILRRIVQPVPSPRVAGLLEQAMGIAERRGIVHRLTMLVHLAHEVALVPPPVDQMPDAPEPCAHGCAFCWCRVLRRIRESRRWRQPCAGSHPARSRAVSDPLPSSDNF